MAPRRALEHSRSHLLHLLGDAIARRVAVLEKRLEELDIHHM